MTASIKEIPEPGGRAAVTAHGLRKAYCDKVVLNASTSASAKARSSRCSARMARVRPRPRLAEIAQRLQRALRGVALTLAEPAPDHAPAPSSTGPHASG